MSKAIPFEKSMSELEELVKQLERGDSSLEECLKQYERGMGLARKCHEALTQAEQKIEVIRVKNLEKDEAFDDE
jgi:exodeoxyribonuclease VII small subunit